MTDVETDNLGAKRTYGGNLQIKVLNLSALKADRINAILKQMCHTLIQQNDARYENTPSRK